MVTQLPEEIHELIFSKVDCAIAAQSYFFAYWCRMNFGYWFNYSEFLKFLVTSGRYSGKAKLDYLFHLGEFEDLHEDMIKHSNRLFMLIQPQRSLFARLTKQILEEKKKNEQELVKRQIASITAQE